MQVNKVMQLGLVIGLLLIGLETAKFFFVMAATFVSLNEAIAWQHFIE